MMSLTRRLTLSTLFAAALCTLGARDASAQDVDRVRSSLLTEVMPQADRFDPADGDPPVKRAYHGDELIGYVFLTSDLPPEESGYSGDITSLVGVTVDGVITGVRATQYRESRRYEWGDFLNEFPYVDQYAGKPVSDRFGVRNDISGISGVTISVRAMARGVRDAARRVTLAYAPALDAPPDIPTEEELLGLSWYEMERRGLVARMLVRQEGRYPFEVGLIHMGSEALGQYLVGRRYESLANRIEEAGGADEVILYVVGGDNFTAPLRTGWRVEQGGSVVDLPSERVVTLGSAQGALIAETSQVGALLLGDDQVDITAPMTIVFDRGRPDLGTFNVDYTSRAALTRMAAAAAPPPEPVAEAATPAPAAEPAPTPAADEPVEATEDVAAPETPTAPGPAVAAEAPVPAAASPAPPAQPLSSIEIVEIPEDEMFESGALGADWLRVGWTALVILLAVLAFFTKKPALRWISLATTMVVLGWVDGGFLSISHVTGLIWVGFSAIGSDLPLLIMAVFTVATVLLWGRVFCGFLCPFGALQDFIERFVPRRLKRELPGDAHWIASKAKYVILAVILGAAILGVEVSLYQYFEPFGTVFFLSPNVVLWSIAVLILGASAVVPRFYCRYVCPLGAFLAVGSLLTLRRIPRVEQCNHCKVCEQRCPTRAISGPNIDFKECVRCNVCEVQLLEQRGVCRHPMSEVGPRLVQLRAKKAAVAE